MRGVLLRVLVTCVCSFAVVNGGVMFLFQPGLIGEISMTCDPRPIAEVEDAASKPYCHDELAAHRNRMNAAHDNTFNPTYHFVAADGVDVPEALTTSPSYPSYVYDMLGEAHRSDGSCKHGQKCLRMMMCSMDIKYTSTSVLTPNAKPTCRLCTPTPCLNYTCPAGKVNGLPGVPTIADGKVLEDPTCPISCAAGYWLTCQSTQECRYFVPTDAQWNTTNTTGKRQWIQQNRKQAEIAMQIPMIDLPEWPVLMTQCYPCTLARNRLHYGEVISSDDYLFSKGYLSFTCPGQSLAPVKCNKNEVARFDPVTRTAMPGDCKCMDGYYRPRAGSDCAACEAGFFCTFTAGKQACPLDTFSYPGSSACIACTKNTFMCPSNMALTRCAPGYQTADARCVDCGVCQQVAPASLGAVPCYRLSSV